MSRRSVLLIALFVLSPLFVTLVRSELVCADGFNQVNYLVVLFEFQDLKHTTPYEQTRKTVIDDIQTYYDEVSYGKLKVVGMISQDWITLPYDVKNMNLFTWESADSEDMRKIDNKVLDILGQQFGGSYSTKFAVYAGKVWGHAYSSIKTIMVNEFHTTATYCHELGHALGLPDLYSYVLSRQGKFPGVNVGPWDPMGGPFYLNHFSSWSKVKLGWIDNQQMVDIKGKLQGTFTIDPIESRNARLLLVTVAISDSQYYYIEVRERLGIDANLDRRIETGVLILLVNYLVQDPREGQVKVMDSHPNSYPRDQRYELFDAPFNIGRNETSAFIDRDRNLSIIVLAKVGASYNITLADAATGDKAIEDNKAISQAQNADQKAETESRLKGLNEAKTQLAKADSAYADGQFANAATIAEAAMEMTNAATVGQRLPLPLCPHLKKPQRPQQSKT